MSNKGIPNHGWSKTLFYARWESMRDRCKNPRYLKYYAGIKVEPRWNLFTNFMADMFDSFQAHAKEHGVRNTTIDRIDPHGDYTKENCRWATWSVQNCNKRETDFFTHDGIKDTLVGWAKRIGVPITTLDYRLRNFPTAEAITMSQADPEIMTFRRAYEALGCHQNTLRRWDRKGILPSIRFDEQGHRYYKKADVLKILEQRRSRPYGTLTKKG